MQKFQSTKVIDGFSACFRQWKAEDTHCKYLHGYAISFHITFEATHLDDRNWVMDFGFMKRSKTFMYTQRHWIDSESTIAGPFSPSDWFKDMFDHTVVVAVDDPNLDDFKVLANEGVLQLRVLPQVGCEMFARFVFEKLNEFLERETDGRVSVVRVECFEHPKNSAVYTSY